MCVRDTIFFQRRRGCAETSWQVRKNIGRTYLHKIEVIPQKTIIMIEVKYKYRKYTNSLENALNCHSFSKHYWHWLTKIFIKESLSYINRPRQSNEMNSGVTEEVQDKDALSKRWGLGPKRIRGRIGWSSKFFFYLLMK